MDKILRTVTRLPKVNLRVAGTSQINCWNQFVIRTSSNLPSSIQTTRTLSTKVEPLKPIVDILDREIQDETTELSRHLSTDQFPGFSVETDDSDVKLTKQVGSTTVTVRFTVSSSLSEWPADGADQQKNQESPDLNMTLLSMPEFQVQITKSNRTLEMSCYFEEMEHDEESGEPFSMDPIFGIDELVMYEGEPKENEFAVNAEYFQEDLQTALLQYLADHGIDDEFAKNLVSFATSYEKKQYIGLMSRLKNFVST